MIIETELRKQPDGSYQYREGYFITLDTIADLVRDFQADQHDGFVSNDKAWVENYLKNKHE